MTSSSDYSPKLDPLRDSCPVRAALDVITGRWKPSILFELRNGPRRFQEVVTGLRGITPQALTVQLRQLEADGVITRKVYAEIPARVEYCISEYGMSLASVMDALDTWGREYLRRQGKEVSCHETCSTGFAGSVTT